VIKFYGEFKFNIPLLFLADIYRFLLPLVFITFFGGTLFNW